MTMKILVVGGGGREHAIALALSRNSDVELYAAMAQANPGIVRLSRKFLIVKETDTQAVTRFAHQNALDYAMIGPRRRSKQVSSTASSRQASPASALPGCSPARDGQGVLQADDGEVRDPRVPRYRVFLEAEDAIRFLEDCPEDLVIKPIGLTGGKGVRIVGEHVDRKGAAAYIRSLQGGVVLEERLLGEEFTLQAFSDGSHIVPMPLVQDHKRAYEGDQGPNTGGMGSYSLPGHDLPFVSESERRKAMQIMQATMRR